MDPRFREDDKKIMNHEIQPQPRQQEPLAPAAKHGLFDAARGKMHKLFSRVQEQVTETKDNIRHTLDGMLHEPEPVNLTDFVSPVSSLKTKKERYPLNKAGKAYAKEHFSFLNHGDAEQNIQEFAARKWEEASDERGQEAALAIGQSMNRMLSSKRRYESKLAEAKAKLEPIIANNSPEKAQEALKDLGIKIDLINDKNALKNLKLNFKKLKEVEQYEFTSEDQRDLEMTNIALEERTIEKQEKRKWKFPSVSVPSTKDMPYLQAAGRGALIGTAIVIGMKLAPMVKTAYEEMLDTRRSASAQVDAEILYPKTIYPIIHEERIEKDNMSDRTFEDQQLQASSGRKAIESLPEATTQSHPVVPDEENIKLLEDASIDSSIQRVDEAGNTQNQPEEIQIEKKNENEAEQDPSVTHQNTVPDVPNPVPTRERLVEIFASERPLSISVSGQYENAKVTVVPFKDVYNPVTRSYQPTGIPYDSIGFIPLPNLSFISEEGEIPLAYKTDMIIWAHQLNHVLHLPEFANALSTDATKISKGAIIPAGNILYQVMASYEEVKDEQLLAYIAGKRGEVPENISLAYLITCPNLAVGDAKNNSELGSKYVVPMRVAAVLDDEAMAQLQKALESGDEIAYASYLQHYASLSSQVN